MKNSSLDSTKITDPIEVRRCKCLPQIEKGNRLTRVEVPACGGRYPSYVLRMFQTKGPRSKDYESNDWFEERPLKGGDLSYCRVS